MPSPESLLSPVIKSALAELNFDLEDELRRYKNKGSQNQSDILSELVIINESSDSNGSQVSSNLPDDTPSVDLFFLDDDFAASLENSLEDEFQNQLLTSELNELTEISTRAEFQKPKDKNSKESEPNLFSPLGIISMIVLLLSSAAVGYLWVDPSGLNRLIKPESNPKPTSALPLQRLELFQPNTAVIQNNINQIPFVDFAKSKPQEVSSQVLRPFLPVIGTLPSGVGRSFESPIRVIPLERVRVRPITKVENPNPVQVDKNVNEKLDENSQLETLPNLEIIPDPELSRPPERSPVINQQPNVVSGTVENNSTLESNQLKENNNPELPPAEVIPKSN